MLEEKNKVIDNWDNLSSEIQKQILELVSKANKKKPFSPAIGEKYYFYAYHDDMGGMQYLKNIKTTCQETTYLKKLGNIFKTKDEAIFAGECDYFTRCFQTYVNTHSEWLDWNNNIQPKYYISKRNDARDFAFGITYMYKYQGVTYANSQEILENAILEIGKETFLKYVLRIGE